MALFEAYIVRYKKTDKTFVCYKGNDTDLTEYQAKYNDSNNQFEIEYDNRRSPVIYPRAVNLYYALISRHLMKYDKDGKFKWDIPSLSLGNGVIVDSNDDVIVVGTREDISSPLYALMGLRKYDSSANFILGYNNGASIEDVAIDSNDNIIFCGPRSGGNSIWKIDSSGVLQWDYDTGDTVHGITVDNNDNIIAVGLRSGLKNVWKLNSAGVLQWDYDIGIAHALRVAVDTNNDIAIVHWATAAPQKGVTKLNSAGVFQWNYDYGTGKNGVDTDSNDNVIVTGGRFNNKTIWLLNAAGVLQWDYDTGAGSESYGIVIDGVDNVYIGNNNNTLIKLNSIGALQWTSALYTVAEGTCLPSKLSIDSLTNIYLSTVLQYGV